MRAILTACAVLAFGTVAWCSPAPGIGDAAPKRTVSLDLREVPLRAALDRLFRTLGVLYGVAPNVPDVPVSVDLRDQPVDSAMRDLIRAAAKQVPGLTAEMESGVCLITIRSPAEPSPPPNDASPPEETVTSEEPIWEKIPVLFADAARVATSMGGEVFPGRAQAPVVAESAAVETPFGTFDRAATPPARGLDGGGGIVPPGLVILGIREDNTLIVRGNPSDIAELRRLLALVDIAPPRFRVRISCGALATESIALQARSARLANTSPGLEFDVDVAPRVDVHGHIRMAVAGSVTAAGVRHPLRTEVRLAPDVSTEIAAFSQGDERVRVYARATVEPEAARDGR